MSLLPYRPLADILRPLLDDPESLHIVVTYFYKLLFDIYVVQTGVHPSTNGTPLGFCNYLIQPTRYSTTQLIRLSEEEWFCQLSKDDPNMTEAARAALKTVDVLEAWAFLSQKLALMALVRPDDIISYRFPGANTRDEKAVHGKLLILHSALYYMKPTNEQWRTLRKLISPQPQCASAPTNIMEQREHFIPGGLYELSNAMGRYLEFPYTMDNAPQYRFELHPGTPGCNNSFTHAQGGIRTPILPAPLARGPREEAIAHILKVFIRIVVNISDLWIECPSPKLWQYRFGLALTIRELNRDLSNPFFKCSDAVKTHISELNITGAWGVLWCLAQHMRHYRQIPLSRLRWEMYAYVMQGATLPNQDARRIVQRVIMRKFETQADPMDGFRPRGFEKTPITEVEQRVLERQAKAVRSRDRAESRLFDSNGETIVQQPPMDRRYPRLFRGS